MRTKRGLHLHRVGKTLLMVSDDESHVDLSRIVSFNGVAARLWRRVEGSIFTTEELANWITAWYDIDPETALADAQKLVEQWTAAGLTE